VLDIIIGIAGLFASATVMAGVCLIITGATFSLAAFRRETGDGGRSLMRSSSKKGEVDSSVFGMLFSSAVSVLEPVQRLVSEQCDSLASVLCDPLGFLRRIYHEDKLSSYVWTMVFIMVKVIMFSYQLAVWLEIVETAKDGLRDGTLEIHCNTAKCKLNRQVNTAFDSF
jgi:hypothetical protein